MIMIMIIIIIILIMMIIMIIMKIMIIAQLPLETVEGLKAKNRMEFESDLCWLELYRYELV